MSDTLFSHPLVLLTIIGLPALGIIAKLAGQTWERIARWYLYASVFAVVVVMDSIFFPFIGGKDWFFRYCVELSLIAAFFWWAFEAKAGEVGKLVRDTFKRPIVIAGSLFVLAVLLSAIFANDVHAAFWSNYERGEGTFQILHYYAFFILLVLLLRAEGMWRRLFGFSLAAAVLMIGYGILGNFGVPTFIGPYAGSSVPAGFFTKFLLGRFQGSLGNPAYVAPYLLFSLFFAAYLWLRKGAKAVGSAARHWGYGILCAVFLIFFLLSQTRGAFIGLGFGIFAFFVYTAFSKNRTLRKVSLAIIAVLIIGGGGILAVRNQPWVGNLPGGRLLQISVSDYTAQTRFWVWKEAWQGFKDRPLLGWGQENFTTVYDKYFNPNFYVPGQATETWFDRAHSVFFDYLVETGILGFAAYLAIFIVFFVEFFKSRRRMTVGEHQGVTHDVERGLILAVPVAYLVQGAAIFDVLPMYIPLFLFLAFVTYYFTNQRPANHV